MIGVRLDFWIVVPACVGKIKGAISMLMNVEAIKGRNIVRCIEGQMKKLRIENYTFIWGFIKLNNSGNVGVG